MMSHETSLFAAEAQLSKHHTSAEHPHHMGGADTWTYFTNQWPEKGQNQSGKTCGFGVPQSLTLSNLPVLSGLKFMLVV